MTTKKHYSFFLAISLLTAVLLSSCASPANRANMEVNASKAEVRNGTESVTVNVSGGTETDAQSSSNISNSELQAAIETSVVRAGLFKNVSQSLQGKYLLSASIIELSKPSFGFSFTVQLEIAWTLTKLDDKTTVFKKVIRTSHTTGMTESFAGVTRLRMAVEGSAQRNINEFIQQIGGKTQ